MSKDPNKYGFEVIKSKKTYKPKSLKKIQKDNSEKALVCSKQIIALLENKLKEFNKNNNKKLSLSDLKKAYKSGFYVNENINLSAIAHVNLFLRISEGKVNLANNFKLNFFEIIGNVVDIRGSVSPENIDYEKAEEDIKKYKLEDFNFKNIDELYLDDEEDRVVLYNL